MAMELEQALKKSQEMLETSESTRVAYEAACGLWLAYAYGD